MGQTLTEFITVKLGGDTALRDEVLAELRWRGMDRDHGLIFEDSMEELDTPTRAPQVGYRVQLRRDIKDKGRYQVTSVDGDRVTVVPLHLTADKRDWEVDPKGSEQTFSRDEVMTVVTHTEKVFPGLVSAGSVGPETGAPSHIAIRGENLHVLRALGYSHAAAVDLIYIDPPYNTGNKDWIYNDRWVDANDGYRHSKWLAFMHRRLELAKDLLKDTGVIIVAIGDDEHHRLRMLMDDIFGEQNFISDVVWQGGRKNDRKYVSNGADYMLVYAKDEGALASAGIRWREDKKGREDAVNKAAELWESSGHDAEEATREYRRWLRGQRTKLDAGVARFKSIDEEGRLFNDDGDLGWPGGGGPKFDVLHPITGRPVRVPSTGWRLTPETMAAEIAAGGIAFGPNENKIPRAKTFLADAEQQVAMSVFEVVRTLGGAHLHNSRGVGVFTEKRFPNPKDHEVLMRWFRLAAPDDAVIVDFFGGSGSTLEAVLRLNEEDGGARQCIIATSNELGEKQERDMTKQGYAPGDPEWEALGVFEYVLRPRTETIITGTRPDGSTYDKALTKNHRVEFFHLDYMDDAGDLDTYIDYDLMVPLLWARAGAVGPFPPRPAPGESVVGDRFAILFDTDRLGEFVEEIAAHDRVDTVFIVSASDEAYRQAASDVTSTVDRPVRTVHLERTYLSSRTWIPRDRRRAR